MLGRALTLAAGLVVGVTLTCINLLTALKVGVWDTGQLTAGFLSSVLHVRARDARVQRVVLAATFAASMGAMPATLGLMAAWPAAALEGHAPGLLDITILGVLLGAFGVALAASLETTLLETERLPFPSGAATAELIGSFESSGSRQTMTRPFLACAALALVVTLARDATGWLPAGLERQVVLGTSTLALGLAVSPMLVGTGTLIGPRIGMSLVAGAFVAWGGVAQSGPTGAALGDWLRWSGSALLIGASLPATVRTLRRLSLALSRKADWPLWSIGLATAGFAWWRLEVPIPLALVGMVLAALLGTVSARVAGATDVAPLGDLAQVSLAAGAAGGQQSALTVGQLMAGSGAQVTGALWNRRIGRGLGVERREQYLAQIAGVLVGAVASAVAWFWLTRTQAIGSPALPAPGAAPWVSLSRVLTQGVDAFPPGTLPWVCGAAVVGLVLALVDRPWLPAPVGLGLAFLLPPPLSLTLGAGAVLGAWVVRRRGDLVGTAVGAGLLAGEALPSVALAAWGALR